MHIGARVIAVATVALWASGVSGCEHGLRRVSQVSPALMAALDTMVAPPGSRARYYRDPDTQEPEATYVVALRTGGVDRFILAQMPMDGGKLIVVADSSGAIPVFDSQVTAEAYRDRIFPLDTDDSTSHNAIVAAHQRMLNKPMRVDLDAVGNWIQSGASPPPPPVTAAAWEILEAANAMPPMVPLDPMGMYALAENHGTMDTASFALVMLGMKVSGLATEPTRGGEDVNRWPKDTAVWSSTDEALLAELMRRGIDRFTARLSRAAAQRDVTETWRTPSGPKVQIVLVSPKDSAGVRLTGGLTDEIEPGFTTFIDARVPRLDPRDSSGITAAAYERYKRDREQYRRDLTAYRQLYVSLLQRQRRAVQLRFSIGNVGDRRADSLTVRLRVPPGLEVVLEGSDPFAPDSPDELRPPSAYADPSVRRKPYSAAYRPTFRELRQKGMYDAISLVSSSPDGGTTVERSPYSLPAHDVLTLDSFVVRWPTWEAVRPFDVVLQVLQGDSVIAELTRHVGVEVRR